MVNRFNFEINKYIYNFQKFDTTDLLLKIFMQVKLL